MTPQLRARWQAIIRALKEAPPAVASRIEADPIWQTELPITIDGKKVRPGLIPVPEGGWQSGKLVDIPPEAVTFDSLDLPPESEAAWWRTVTRVEEILASSKEVRKPPMPSQIPHWQRALDAKFEAAEVLRKVATTLNREEYFFPESTDLHDPETVKAVLAKATTTRELREMGYTEDLKLLPGAQAYSFSPETEAAILEAAQSIPHESPLSSIETPNTGSGWFWFSQPLDVAASPEASSKTHALLWAWVERKTENFPAGTDISFINQVLREGVGPALMFSAYVLDENGRILQGKPIPSTRWYWPFHMTFHQMLAFNAAQWRRAYGPGARLEHDPHIVGEKETLKVIADLSLFFLMACLWFRQTVPGQPKKKMDPVLVQSPGHIERHAKKRYQREFKLPEQPTVQVVALRKTARTPIEVLEPHEHGAREYRCKWIVQGHPRLQPCGPGHKDRKLIWISAHIAGPDDKPLRTKTKVYAVVR